MSKVDCMSHKSEIEVIERSGAGRPKKEINWQLFEDLCSIQCTQGEIASILHLDVSTLHDRSEEYYNLKYPDIYKKFSEIGKISLRRLQFKHAQKSFAMAIWLGKQWLGQRDHDQMISAPPELTQQFNAIMVQIGKSQQEAHELYEPYPQSLNESTIESTILPNNSSANHLT